MNQQLLMTIPGITAEEIIFMKEATKDLSETQQNNFIAIYNGRRKDPQTILLCTLIGFLGAAGIQRFLINQIGMGILYLFTGGFCLIGTIIDLVNYQKLALEYNRTMIVESTHLASSF